MEETMKLKDITLSIFDGKHGDCKDKEGSGVYFVSVKDLREYEIDYSKARQIDEIEFEQNYKRTNLEVGDTIYANTGDTIGKSLYVVDNPLVTKTSFQKSVAVVKPDQSFVDPKYLYYLLKYETPRLRKAATGSGQKNLLLSTMREFEIDIHERKFQEQIAAVLGTIDDKIRVNSKINDNLQQMSKTIYDYWFTQFDFPNEHGNPYASSNGQMEWNETSKQKLPVGWSCSKMETAIENIRTGLNPRDNFKLGNGSIKYITVKNLCSNGALDFSGCDTIDETARQIVHRRSDVSVGDILFASIAPLGRCYLVQEAPQNWDINESVFSIRYNKDTITPEYLYMYLQSETFVKESTACSTGSIFKGIRINSLMDSKIIVPPMPVIEDFSKEVRPLFAMQSKLNKETLVLTQLRDWILPMLMNGQATIED